MKRHWLTAALGCAAWSAASAQSSDPLLDGFRDPPASARPRSWWHWLNVNITAEGLTKDLEWMKAVGLGGVQAFDASLGTPQLVSHPLAYMTPEWKAAFNSAAATADRLGLELGISSSPGWSETGGPWVPPADGMKKLVWSTLDVAGGQRVAQPLPAPPAVTGPYGTAPYADPMATPGVKPTPNLSGPVAVFAYPIDAEMIVPPGAISVEGGGVLDAAALTDAREDTTVKLPQRAGTVSSVLVAWPSQRAIRSATLFVPGAIAPFGGAAFAPVLEAEQVGGWTRVADLPLGNVPTTVAFAPITARRFRVRFLPSAAAPPSLSAPAPGAVVANIFATPAPDQPITVATLSLTSEERVDQFEQKAGFAAVPDYYALSTTAPEVGGIAPRQVIDLSSRMGPNGRLNWTPPKGRWRIVRMGWSLLGTTNHPAAVDATGLEVDKYDGAAVRRYMDHYLATYQPAIATGAVKALVTDSIEAGDANWTPALLERFQALRGYDPRPWLPTLTGAVIGSRTQSDAFLYDWRRTLADLLASEHYGTIATIARANKLLVYGEALENGRPQLGDDMQMRAQADVPMAAMWAFGRGEPPRSTLIGDIYGAASVAHLTGRNLVAAESFTAAFSPWAFAPADLKRVADLEFGLGVNRPVIHTSVSSPMDDKLPGLSLAIFGQYFNRRDSWSGMARPWVDYLARTSYLMQQGHHVADLAYFIGEEAPLTALFDRNAPADLPKQRGFDFVDAEFLTKLSADKDGIGSAGGAHYRLLYLGGTSRHMTLPTLRHIADLVQAGAIVVGPAPVVTPSLADDAKAFQTLVARLWPGAGVAHVGAGRVYASGDMEAAFHDLSLPPDVTTERGEVLFQHRALSDGDIYFVHNRGTDPVAGGISFRTAGRVPELWDPDTGLTRPLSYRRAGDYTWVDLPLSAEDTALVMFRSAATASSRTVPPPREMELSQANPAWTVDFEKGRGAPPFLALPRLEDLSHRSEAGVRYFSGSATYQGTLTLKHRDPSARLMLDLGQVGDVAQVRVNGIEVGAAWQAPYRVNVTKAVRLGTNRIEIRVANLWVNRLIGDAQPGANKITFVVAPTYRPDAPLRPSGLIGPVRLIAETRVEEATERSAP